MSNSRQLLGKKGEEVAVTYLSNKGYKLVSRNYRCRYGEIDIIALDKSVLVFIEVKTRSNFNYGSAASAVTSRKRGQISRVALYYLQENKFSESEARFDVVEINKNRCGDLEANHIINAFELACRA